MFTTRRTILTVAGVITIATMTGGIGAVAVESRHAASSPAVAAPTAFTTPAAAQFHDDAGGGDS